MKRKRGWLLYPLIILALLFSVVPAYAQIPGIPHAFYGTLTISGSPAAVGTVVTAKVGGVQYGSITTTVAGQYGGSGPFDAKLTVSGDIDTGATISFYINGADTTQTYAFSAGGVTELNLTVGDADTTPPTVVSTSPATGATGVAVGTTVSVTFSEAMDASTITTSSFTLSNGGSVSGTVSYNSGTNTTTFTPGASLSYSTTYTATLSTAMTDTAGNPLASAYSWSFTTGETVIPGDATGDSSVDALDITKVERIIAALDTETSGADANQDGNVNALDITKVERIIAGLD